MPEGLGQRPDDVKTMSLPQMHRGLVGRDDQVVLHCPEAKGQGLKLCMDVQRSSYVFAR